MPTILTVPFYFGVQVVKSSDSPTSGYWTLTEFGETSFFKIYSVLIMLIESVIPLITLMVLNKISLAKFKIIMWMVVQDNRRADQANNRFTKLILTLTFICIVTRSFDIAITIYNRAKLFFRIELTEDLNALLRLVRNVSYLLVFAAHALDGLLYYFSDKKMKSIFSRNP